MEFKDIKAELDRYREAAIGMRDIILANAVMIGEIPAPTFYEDQRIRFVEDRFSECGLQNCSTDEVGNGFGVLNGSSGERTLLLVAHADTVFGSKIDHTLSMRADRLIGPGVGDNSLGVAVLASLPTLLERLGIHLKSNLILMAASRGLGRGNLEGLRFFLNNHKQPIAGALCVEGVKLGRLSYSSIGMLRGEINVRVPEMYDWTRFGASGAVIMLNDIINKINRIPLPKRPKTSIVLGSIEGGNSFNNIATHSLLRFEIRSESADVVHGILDEIRDRITEIELESSAEITLDIVARREPGGIDFRHPLVRRSRDILKTLQIEPHVAPSTSELAELIRHGVPAITLGLTTGEKHAQVMEEVAIEPIFTGIAQLLGLLIAMDEGLCDEH
jgi:tripeptide aminopeptidase